VKGGARGDPGAGPERGQVCQMRTVADRLTKEAIRRGLRGSVAWSWWSGRDSAVPGTREEPSDSKRWLGSAVSPG
jgi:hypothetical protein